METRRSISGAVDLGVDLAGVEDGAEAVVAVGVGAGEAGDGEKAKIESKGTRSDHALNTRAVPTD